METLIWTGPGLGQILPRRREEGCQQNLTEALSQGRHGFTVRETLPWKNTHMGLPEGGIRPYGHLAQYRG